MPCLYCTSSDTLWVSPRAESRMFLEIDPLPHWWNYCLLEELGSPETVSDLLSYGQNPVTGTLMFDSNSKQKKKVTKFSWKECSGLNPGSPVWRTVQELGGICKSQPHTGYPLCWSSRAEGGLLLSRGAAISQQCLQWSFCTFKPPKGLDSASNVNLLFG